MNNFNIENVRFMCNKPRTNKRLINVVNKSNCIMNILMNGTILRLNDDSNDRYLQIRQGNTAYNLQIYNKTQIIDTTVIQNGNTGRLCVIQNWLIECLDDRNGRW